MFLSDICPGKTRQTDASHHLHHTGKNNVDGRGIRLEDRYEHVCCFCGVTKQLTYIYAESGGLCNWVTTYKDGL